MGSFYLHVNIAFPDNPFCFGDFNFFISFKVTPDLRRCPQGKNWRAILKESTANYISLESLINVDFGKNINCGRTFKKVWSNLK